MPLSCKGKDLFVPGLAGRWNGYKFILELQAVATCWAYAEPELALGTCRDSVCA